MSRRLRAMAVAGFAGVTILTTAAPAGAHGLGGTQPTNYQTRVFGIEPSLPGVALRAVEVGSQLQLTNDSDAPVTVLGYDDEPYLRVGPDGVFENRHSPAAFLNRSSVARDEPPREFDADAQPEWRKVSDGRTVRWHDHRAHWMGTDDPPDVLRDPGTTHAVIERWEVPLETDGRRYVAAGDVRWIPGPSPWTWVLVAVMSGAALVAASRTRWWAAAAIVALALLLVGEGAHAVGVWTDAVEPFWNRLLAVVYSVGAIAVGAIAMRSTWRRNPADAAPMVLIAGIFLVVAGGLAGLTTLTRSQLPTSLPPGVARAGVAASLGLGAGLVIGSVLWLRPRPA